jgi:hypothetical protein
VHCILSRFKVLRSEDSCCSVRPRSPFPAKGWLGCSHRRLLNVSMLGSHFFFSFELPYLKAFKKAHVATDWYAS